MSIVKTESHQKIHNFEQNNPTMLQSEDHCTTGTCTRMEFSEDMGESSLSFHFSCSFFLKPGTARRHGIGHKDLPIKRSIVYTVQ